jgi:hypothetical protein
MLRKAEDSRTNGSLVHAKALEHGHAVVKRVAENMGGGARPGNELSVVPNEAVAIVHGAASVGFGAGYRAFVAEDTATTLNTLIGKKE